MTDHFCNSTTGTYRNAVFAAGVLSLNYYWAPFGSSDLCLGRLSTTYVNKASKFGAFQIRKNSRWGVDELALSHGRKVAFCFTVRND